MQNLKLPHWAIIVLGLVALVIPWIMNQVANGALVLPASVMNVLVVVSGVVGMLSPSVSPETNLRAVRRAAGAALTLVLLGLGIATQGACTQAQGAKVETVTIDSTICILNHVSDPPQQIAVECGLAAVEDVIKVLTAHRAAMARELADAGSVKP